jgi:membrane peptidoglycan carboxypeptidase
MAPVALPAPAVPRPATLTDVSGKVVDTVQPPTPAEQLPADQIPDQMLRAIAAVQDPGYFSRRGLSPGDLVAAGAADLVRVRRHGGTIEERYARQVRVAAGSRVPSLRESGVAVRLSKQLSRRDLLTRYVNGMYFGNGVYGVGAASRFYFGVPLVRLGTPQIAMLAGIADDPTRNNPLIAPERAAAAQHDALTAMQLAGVLTGTQATEAGRVRVVVQPHRPLERAPVAPDFAGLVESSLLARYGEDAVYGDALQVATTLDLDLQAALDDTVRRYVAAGTPAVLGLATDPRSGDVRAMLARGIPGGAAEVLFQRRPLGSLAQRLAPGPGDAPVPPPGLGDGRSATVGDVASVVGAIAADGVRRDPREVLSVTRPATDDSAAVVLDAADPLPAGASIMAADAAGNLTAAFRTAARRPGPTGTRVGFALALVDGSDPTGHWTAGCVPALCLTVWTGPAGPVPAPGAAQAGGNAASVAADAAAAALGRQIVVGTFTQFLAAAPGRIDVPALPTPRPEPRALPSRSVAPAPRVSARPVAPARRPRPVPTASRSASPTPTASPSPSSRPTPAPSPSVSAGPPAGSGGSGGSGGGGGSGHGPEAAPPVVGRR